MAVPALITPEESLTYAELDRRAAALGLDAGPGDRVALEQPADASFAVALHACRRAGAAAMPIDARLAPAEREAQRAAARTPSPPGTATVMHTSGTTGSPRAVELTAENWAANAAGSRAVLGLDPQERWLCALPLSHVGGLSILIRSAAYGTTTILHPRFDAEAVTRVLMDGEATLVSLVPTMLARLLDAGLDAPPRLRCALIGGGPLDAGLLERTQRARIPLAQTYGLTEACSQVTTSAIGAPQTAGHALPGTTVTLAPDDEILVSGPTVAPAAGPKLATGDLGALDDQGRLTVTARKSELIVSGGENVAPAEVEAVLAAHPAVLEAAVFGRPDPEWGERVVAAVVLREGMRAGDTELREHTAARLAGFKVPKEIETVAELPRTASGKLRRAALRPHR